MLPEEIYLFQGDKYIDTCERVQTYNRVMAEQTEEDTVNYIEQRKKIAKFGKWVKENAIEELGVMKSAATPSQHTEPEELEVVAMASQETGQVSEGFNEVNGHFDPIGDI